MSKEMKLPTDAKERKGIPLVTGVLDYFPDALSAVAELSLKGNQQHHKDAPLHWDKSKSSDHADCLGRHLIDRGTLDSDGVRHSAKVAWRALALLQVEIDKEKAELLELTEGVTTIKPEFKVGDKVIINTGHHFGRTGKINSIVGSGCVIKLDGRLERGYIRVDCEVLFDMQDIKLLYKD
jgi:hypothetical protein